MNRGYVSVFLSSVKVLIAQLESVKGSIDESVYNRSMSELNAMKKVMEELLGTD